jgi:hypothetical protein
MYKNKSLIGLLAFERRRSGVRSGGKSPLYYVKGKSWGGEEWGERRC